MSDSIEQAIIQVSMAIEEYEKAMVSANTSADAMDGVTNNLNLAGVAGENMVHAQQVKQAFEHASSDCARGRDALEGVRNQLIAMREQGF